MRLDPILAAGIYQEQVPLRTGRVKIVCQLAMLAMLAAHHRDLQPAPPEWEWPDVEEGFNGE